MHVEMCINTLWATDTRSAKKNSKKGMSSDGDADLERNHGLGPHATN